MEIEKKYYSIGEVADLFGVSTSLIRFWESQFSNIKPKKNKGGVRRYTKEDLEQIRMIYKLVKEKGYTLQGAKEALEHRPQITTRLQAVEHLKDLRQFLLHLKESIPATPEEPKE